MCKSNLREKIFREIQNDNLAVFRSLRDINRRLDKIDIDPEEKRVMRAVIDLASDKSCSNDGWLRVLIGSEVD